MPMLRSYAPNGTEETIAAFLTRFFLEEEPTLVKSIYIDQVIDPVYHLQPGRDFLPGLCDFLERIHKESTLLDLGISS